MFKRQENHVFLATFQVFRPNSFEIDQNQLKSILYYVYLEFSH
jgi:hypothetical protein